MMTWRERYPKTCEPTLSQIAEHIGSPLWQELCGYAETAYGSRPKVEYSTCAGAPGWNVKYKAGGRALCTLYPHEGYFTCLICIGAKEATEAELALAACRPYTRELFQNAGALNGARWLMIDVTSREILEDAQRLLRVRTKPKGKV